MLTILYQLSTSGEELSFLREETVKILSAFSYYKNTANLKEAVKKCPEQWRKDFADIYEKISTGCKAGTAFGFR